MPSFHIIKNHKQEKHIFQKNLLLVVLFIVVAVFLLILRLFYLQVWQHKFFSTLSDQNHLALVPYEPNRGLIFDRNGVLLAENVTIFSLDVLPNHKKVFIKNLPKLREIISIDDDELEHFYKAYSEQRLEPVPLKLNLKPEEVASFYLNKYKFSEINVNARLVRHYPFGIDTVSVLGYMGRISPRELKSLPDANYKVSDFIGKTGVEKYYEESLRGKTGHKQVEIDVTGRVVRVLKSTLPIPGDDLYLTIDINLQKVAKEALGEERGAVVLLMPENGEILALISNPAFDPNQFAAGISSEAYRKLQNSPDNPMYNRAICGQFPPGSVVKPFLALFGLDSKLIDENYTIDDPGWFKLPNAKHIYRDWDRRGHGKVDVVKAIIVSCDIFFYNLAVMMGIDGIGKILTDFGFGRKTEIDVGEEKTGNIPSPLWKMRKFGERWFVGNTVISGIGQGYMLATPLQLANAVAMMANRGISFVPHFLLKKKSPNGEVVVTNRVLKNNLVLNDAKNWDIVIRGMHGVIASDDPPGTGRNKFGIDFPYSVAAKTATIQLYHQKRNDENEAWQKKHVEKRLRNNSAFIAFAPVEKPKIAVAVVVENSLIAASVARKVLDSYFANYHANTAKLQQVPLLKE